MDEIAGMAELADALDLGSSGRPCRFESCCPHSVVNPCIYGKNAVFTRVFRCLSYYMKCFLTASSPMPPTSLTWWPAFV